MFVILDICLRVGFSIPVSPSGFVCMIGLIYCALTSRLFSTLIVDYPFHKTAFGSSTLLSQSSTSQPPHVFEL